MNSYVWVCALAIVVVVVELVYRRPSTCLEFACKSRWTAADDKFEPTAKSSARSSEQTFADSTYWDQLSTIAIPVTQKPRTTSAMEATTNAASRMSTTTTTTTTHTQLSAAERDWCDKGVTSSWSAEPMRCMRSNQLRVLCIGSTTRPDLLEAQRRTLGTQLNLTIVDEVIVNTAHPHLCAGVGSDTNFTSHSGGCLNRHGDEMNPLPCKGKWKRIVGGNGVPRELTSNESAGWWCAQKRLVAAVEIYLQRHFDQDLPAFLLVIDDDTFVNVDKIAAVLRGFDPDSKLYGGASTCGVGADAYLLGGAGHVISRATLRAVRGNIQQCVTNAGTSGRWCDWHSDWMLAKCIVLYSGTRVTNLAKRLKKAQTGQSHRGTLTFEQSLGDMCNDQQVTCHADRDRPRITAKNLFDFATNFYGLTNSLTTLKVHV